MPLHDKYQKAMITGASSGLGRAIALALANEKISLILVGRDQSQLSQISSYLRAHVNTSFLSADVSQSNDMERIKQLLYEQAPDLIINSAGIGLYGEALTHKTSEQVKILDVNCRALTEITLEAARTLKTKNKKGTILNISSVSGFVPSPCFSIYAASKAYVTHFSRSLDPELKSFGIRVFSSCPGQVDTDFGKRAGRVTPKKISKMVMTQEEATACILYQLIKEIPIYTFNWRYRLIVALSKFIPQKIIQKNIQKEILGRINKREFIPISE